MKIVKKILTIGLSIAILGGSVVTSESYNKPNINRIAGKDNYETAALIADKQIYSTAILVNLDNSIADGLSSSGLSGAVNAPILLTQKDSIPDVTMTRLNKAKKVYIIGGVNSVKPEVESSLKSKGLEVIRIQGKDRIETSLNVANEIKKYNKSDYVFFTNGFKGEADAISVSFLSAQKQSPIIQTDGKSTTYKVSSDQSSLVIGGRATMSEGFVNKTNSFRIGGEDRFDTNHRLISFAYEEEAGDDENYFYTGNVHIADGYNLVNALVASPIAKYEPTVLVSKNSNKVILEDANKITILGTIDKDVEKRLTVVDPASNIIGTWKESDEFGNEIIKIDTSTFNGYPYELLSVDKSKNYAKLLVHFPKEDDVRDKGKGVIVELTCSRYTMSWDWYADFRGTHTYGIEYERVE